jgi:hypothetical protein
MSLNFEMEKRVKEVIDKTTKLKDYLTRQKNKKSLHEITKPDGKL